MIFHGNPVGNTGNGRNWYQFKSSNNDFFFVFCSPSILTKFNFEFCQRSAYQIFLFFLVYVCDCRYLSHLFYI
jgi:hypothetical protein